MNITRVSIRPVDMKSVKALASITIDDEFVIHDLRIVKGEHGYFVAMPSRRLPNGEHKDIAHPICPECRDEIQLAVLDKFGEDS